MKWINTTAKKWTLGATALLAVVSFGVSIFQAQAANAASARWLNRYFIEVDGVNYFDSDTHDGIYEYIAQSGATCPNKVVFEWKFGTRADRFQENTNFYWVTAKTDTHADLYTNGYNKKLYIGKEQTSAAGQKFCAWDERQDLSIADSNNRRIMFYKNTTNQIVHIPTGATFDQQGDYKGFARYFRTDEVADANNSCPDMIIMHEANVMSAGENYFGRGNQAGSSILFSVVRDSHLARKSESYDLDSEPNKIGRKECTVKGVNKQNGDAYAVYTSGDSDDDQIFLSSGLNESGNVAPDDDDYKDDAFIIFVGDMSNVPKTPTGAPITSPIGSDPDKVNDQVCKGGGLGWIVCPIVSAIQSTSDLIRTAMQKLLSVNPLPIDGNEPLYKAWDNVRNLANIGFVFAFFTLVFSQATSIGISTFGVKRFLSKIFVYAALANVSYVLASIAVDVFNIAGVGAYNLLAIINNGDQGTVTISNGAGGIFVGGIATAVGVAIATTQVVQIFPLLAAAFVGMILTFIVLVARQAILIFLTIVSPLAVVAGLFKPSVLSKAANAYFGLLGMYPAVMLLFGASRLAGSILTSVAGDSNLSLFVEVGGLLIQIILGFAAIFLFKWTMVAKTALGRMAGNLQGRFGKGLVDRANEFAQNTSFAQRRKLARDNRQRERQRQGAEDYARIMTGDGLRSRLLRRRAGGYFNPVGQQRAYADVRGVVERQFNEDKDRARSMMSVNAARAFGDAGTDAARLRAIVNNTGSYTTSTGQVINFSAQDQEAIRNLNSAGFLRGSNNRAGAAAAIDELFDQQFVSESDIQNLARVAGTDTESAGLMTKTISNAAAKNKYKNFTYGAVESGTGNYQQYQSGPGTKDGLRIVESGLSGAPKEIYDDASILAGLAHKTRGADEASIVDVARQTLSVDKAGTVKKIADAIGVSEAEFIALRQALQTNTLGANPGILTAAAASAAGRPMTTRSAEIKAQLKATAARRTAAGDFTPDLTYIATL